MQRPEIGRGECCRLSTLPCYTGEWQRCSEVSWGSREAGDESPAYQPVPFRLAGRHRNEVAPNRQLANGQLWRDKHEHDCRDNHEVGIQEDEYTSVVEAPFALEAAGCLGHAPYGNQQSENLPVGALEVFYVREAGEAQAGGKCAEREKNGADERFLPQAEDREEMMHNPSMYRGGYLGRAAGLPREAMQLGGTPRVIHFVRLRRSS